MGDAKIWGPAVCYGPPGKNAKVQEETNRKILFFPCIFDEILAKIGPRTSGKPVRSFWTGLSLPRPFPTHFTSILYFATFFWKKMFVFLCISYIFIIFSALEAPRPVPNCRSHFSAQTRVIESFWNPQGTSFVTKQCPKGIAKKYAKSRHNHQPAGCKPPTSWLVACKQPTSWLVVCKQPTSWLVVCKPRPNPTLVAFRGPGHPKAFFRQKQQH